ncbi:MAG TPA: hypothetical protein VM285_12175, partial [Polyangia bacterium]|nr:hypothetical protein [Polyangia bacterium]
AEVFPNPIAFGPGLKGSDSNIWLYHHATSSQIGTGDVLIERVGISDGSEMALIGSVQYMFETTPALVSYSDGQGNSATPDYPVPGSGPGTSSDLFLVQAGPSGDVVLDLTFWRPQRRPIPPETGKWIDMGGLEYVVSIWTDAGYFTCEAGAYATSDPNLEIVDGIGSPVGGGFRDLADDQTPRTDNTFRFQLNLT